MNENESDEEISWRVYLKHFTHPKEVKAHSDGAFHFGEFYGLKYLGF